MWFLIGLNIENVVKSGYIFDIQQRILAKWT